MFGKRILRKSKPNFSTPKWIAAKWQQRMAMVSVLRTVILKRKEF